MPTHTHTHAYTNKKKKTNQVPVGGINKSKQFFFNEKKSKQS
jgi:hypothetical protein